MSKAAVVFCDNYDFDKVYEAILKGINLLGGVGKFIKKGETILLKPNMLFAALPSKGLATHPVIFEAVLKILYDFGANVTYGDSPGFGKPLQVAKKCGFTDVARKYGIKMSDFEDGKVVKLNDGVSEVSFNIANAVLESDGLINLPKMKAHELTRITGAVKNLLGCVYGSHKQMFHSKFQKAYDFCRMLSCLANYIKPRLNIMDGIIAMEGNGPSNGDLVKMNCIIVSDDPIALDSIFCKIINLDPEYVATNVFGKQIGLGTYATDEIELVGDDIDRLINKRFKVVRQPVKEETKILPFAHLFNLVINRPVIKKGKCKKCGICIEACPLEDKAIYFENNKKPPVYDYYKCIKCYCCQEMCPHDAIYVKRPLLNRLFY